MVVLIGAVETGNAPKYNMAGSFKPLGSMVNLANHLDIPIDRSW